MHSNNNIRRHSKSKQITFGPYVVGSTLGEGEFGKVKLGWTKPSSESLGVSNIPKQVAIKLIRRDTITRHSEKEIKIYREINALKHLTHPNIIKLEEVLQNSKYIGIVLEYASGGEFYKYIQRNRRLKENKAARLFSQLVSGVYYMHSKGLVHRDLKLENLLLDKNENLIITDFGFVNEFSRHNELMKTSCGSPCYAAPELVVSTQHYAGRKADVWSCGIILFAMLAGYLPWDDDKTNPNGDDIAKLYRYITTTPLKFPEYIGPVARDLLRKILVSDPEQRYTLRLVQRHELLRPHASFLNVSPRDWDIPSRSVEASKMLQPQQRPCSTYSSVSNSSRSRKRNSLIVDPPLSSTAAPMAEHTSHSMVKPQKMSEKRQISEDKPYKHNKTNSIDPEVLGAVVHSGNKRNTISIVNQDFTVDSSDIATTGDHKYAYYKHKISHSSDTKQRKPRPTTYHLTVSNSENIKEVSGVKLTAYEKTPTKDSDYHVLAEIPEPNVQKMESKNDPKLKQLDTDIHNRRVSGITTYDSSSAPLSVGDRAKTYDKKRFSFLSFYGSRNSTRTTLYSDVSKEFDKPKVVNTQASNDSVTYTTAPSTNKTSRGVHYKTSNPEDASPNSYPKNIRASVMVSSVGRNSSHQSDKDVDEEKGPSTARKLIDFFKRRSMRI